ncbi:hypothetical protein GCM10009801_81620 [Streptomyces albiaxialis]|uniref:DUF3558 domain-containing protein n=1 Tax=Streptomyces albiaxialis TaxID=329523 RepID=A0ABN2X4V1_9ACTN
MSRISRSGGVVFCAIIASLSMALGGCSSEEPETPKRGYPVPSEFCGLNVSRGALLEIFKGGKRIKKENGAPWGDKSGLDSQGCRYDIDGLPSVDLDGNWVSRDYPVRTPDPKAALKKYYPSAKPRRHNGRYDSATWLHGFVVTLKCRSHDENYRYDWFQLRLNVDHLLHKDDAARTHKEFEKLATGVAVEAEKRLACEGK